ncbi:activator-dependent family glycosyltransferase [Verrucosispora sp. SN26_14.1]|nr:activator-dependent family glycosyltransferase [Verrucosispora sp. SN26_14.1]
MRVLFAANPEKSHLLAMAPLAWALRTAGHEVRFAVQPAYADIVKQAGLTAVPLGRDVDLWKELARDPFNPGWTWDPAYGLPKPYDVVDDPSLATWDHLMHGYAEALHTWHKPGSFPMIAALVEYARRWRPDLVIWEPMCFAGPIAAKAVGAAHARLLWSADVFGVTRDRFLRLQAQQPEGDETRFDPLAHWLGGYANKYGGEFTEDMVTGHFTLDQMPPSLRMQASLDYVSYRFVPYGGPADVPRWLWDAPTRPRVALSMGLSLTDHQAGYAINLQDVLDALSDVNVELVATVPESERHRLARIPDNARLVSYVPLHALAPSCAAVINHGGFGTVLTAARYGVPQLALPWDFDGPAFCAGLTAQGGSLVIRADEATGEAVRESVLRLVREERFPIAAGHLRQEMLNMPSPNDIVPLLEMLTAKHQR